MPRKLDLDLDNFSSDTWQLKTLADLQRLKEVAQDRRRWKILVDDMCVAAKAAENF